MSKLSHFDEKGGSKMVDVSEKSETTRIAIAKGEVKLAAETLDLILDKKMAKGDVLEVARVAGIMGAKKTPELIPMCHPLLISGIDLKYNIRRTDSRIEIISRVKISGKTGVEMEALTAVTIAALTIYDMCKAVDKRIEIGEIKLLKKTGGKTGVYLSDELKGEVIAICTSQEKGVAKTEISKANLLENHGLEGDAHAGQWHRQVSLLGQEDIDKMKAMGLELEFGAFGENIVTKGLKLYKLPIGTKLKLADDLLLEVTQIGKKCHDRCNIYHQVGDCIMPKRGIFTKVLQGGKLEKGAEIEVLLDD